MKMNPQERTVHIPDESLVEPEAAHKEAVMLGAVMMYPEHPEKHAPYILAVQKSVVDLYCYSQEDKESFYLDHPLLADRVAADSGKAPEVLTRSTLSRKAGLTGSLAVRGAIAGQLLTLLLDPNIPQATTLGAAYAWYIDKFKTEYEVNRPTRPLLKAIWGEFRHVAHLWAAQQVYKKQNTTKFFSRDFATRVNQSHTRRPRPSSRHFSALHPTFGASL